MRVAYQTSLLCDPRTNDAPVAAAWLHDVLEDCPEFVGRLWLDFDAEIGILVQELTNPSKDKRHLPRRVRKEMDFDHIRGASRWAKIIKYLDRIDNLNELAGADPDFRKLYVKESKMLADSLFVLGDPDIGLLNQRLYEAIDTKPPNIIQMRQPPWTCVKCRAETVTMFRFITKGIGAGMLEATCEVCNETAYSS